LVLVLLLWYLPNAVLHGKTFAEIHVIISWRSFSDLRSKSSGVCHRSSCCDAKFRRLIAL
jgi:hypothetical protein